MTVKMWRACGSRLFVISHSMSNRVVIGAGTQLWISPKANVAGLMMTQRQMAFTHPFAVEFKRLAYEAVRRKR